MANQERYIFSVEAQTDGAISKLQEINRLMDQIEKTKSKGENNYNTTNQKDMDRSMRSMAQLSKMYKDVSQDLTEIQKKMQEASKGMTIPQGASREQIREIQKVKAAQQEQATQVRSQQRALRQEYERTLKSYRELSTFQQNYSKNFSHVFSSKDVYNLPKDSGRARNVVDSMFDNRDGSSGKLSEISKMINEVNKLDRRSESLSRRASASGYMSHQQFSNFQDDYKMSRGSYVRERELNKQAATDIGQERTRLTNEIKNIESNENASQADIDRKIALQRTVETMDKEFEARMELNRSLDSTIKNMEEYNQRLRNAADGRGAEVKPERGTFKGMLYERAPAIGLALGGAMGLAFGGLYAKGGQVESGMRDDVVSIGQRTNQTDWRSNVRDNAFDMGLQDYMGFSGQEMLNFQNAYLSNRGFQNIDDLNTAASSQAEFSRVTGLNAETTSSFFDDLFGSAKLTGTDVADIQNAFVGGIKQSGMEGREEDQLKALNSIVDGVSQGRVVNNSDVMNLMGLQTLLSSSGNKALQGSSGAQLLTDLNSGFRGAVDDPSARLMFGMGSQFQGLSGGWDLAQQLEEGISNVDNINMIGRVAEGMAGDEEGQNYAAYKFIRSTLGVDATTEQTSGLMDLYRNNELTQENINKILNQSSEEGSQISDEKLGNYQDSKEATANQSESTTEKQAANLNDFGDILRNVNTAMGGLPAPVYASIVALGALAAAAAGTAASFGMSRGVRGLASGKRYGGGNGRGGKGGGPGGRVGDFFAGASNTIGGWFDPNRRKGGLPNDGPKNKGGGGKGLGLLANSGAPGGGGIGSMATKAFLPLALLSGGASVMGAPEGEKMTALGQSAGGLGGGLGGAGLGAAIGSAILPGIGTVAGGLLGSVAGSSIGSSVGGWIGEKVSGIGDWFSGLFGGKDDKKSESGDMQAQVDRENATKKERNEQKRQENTAAERALADRQEKILGKGEQMLRQSNLQNGIFGEPLGAGSMGAASAVSGSGNQEKIWNFFADKGLSPAAISGIMGNLQQESGLNPTAKNASSGAYGIAQWLGPRKTELEKFAVNTGGSTQDLNTQLEFLWKELNGSEKGQFNKFGGLDSFFNSTDPKQAADIFEKAFERSGGSAMDKRRDYANDFYNNMGKASVESTINVNVTGDQSVSEQINNNAEMDRAARKIQEKIYSSMSFHSYETRRT